MSGSGQIGRSTRRLEDEPLVRGEGCFLDDINAAGALEVAFLRSPHPHARILKVDAQDARRLPGVTAIFTLSELLPLLASRRLPLQFPDATLPRDITPFVLADDEVVYVGEPIALIAAESRYVAEDAAAQISVEYEPLPAIADCKAAIAPGASCVHSTLPNNVIAAFNQSYGDVTAAFGKAAHKLRVSLKQHRGSAHPLESRGVLASYEAARRHLTFWSSTQLPHELRTALMKMLPLDETTLRVVTPDVGGGFGAKYLIYAEEVALAAAALKLKRSVKWVEDRREHAIAAIQERDQYWDVEVAFDAEGRLHAARGHMVHDQGAYTPQGINVAYNAATAFPGPYVLPAYSLKVVAASTNKVPGSTVRGAGYPQGAFAMERCLDRIAAHLSIDRVEVRRRNLVPRDKIPYSTPLKTRSGKSIVLDSGDFAATLNTALEAIDYAGFAERRRRHQAAGLYTGIGVACGMKGSGRGPYESAIVRIGQSGKISIASGAAPMGQGLCTALAQICAAEFGVAPEDISVVLGDTAAVPLGMGGFASRQTVTAGSSVHLAAVQVRDKVLKIAGHLLEASVEDLECADGRVEIKGVPGRGVSLREIATAAYGSPGYAIPGGLTAGLEYAENFAPDGLTYGMGCHAVEIELDIGTCRPRIVRYVVANDCGRIVNPTIVEGQLVGGAVHGIGNALFEWMGYDDNAQPVTVTFADYLLPTATDVPRIDVKLLEFPSPLNPLGVKGVGESGSIPAAAAIVSALEHALEPFGVEIDQVPITPAALYGLLQQARMRE
jgi:carbon-monoxide dehydrogenase large subunit